MPVDYSKWDNLELSDDSDIEVHPNVDKKSFIRAKQNQIHQQRYERKNKIETYKYERIINDGLLKRVNALFSALQSHTEEAEKKNPDQIFFQAIMESVGEASDDNPPPRPEGVHSNEKDSPLPTYSKMLAVMVDQVKEKVEKDGHENKFEAYCAEIKAHQAKIEDLQQKLEVELATLEQEGSKAITSESYHTGFETSHISKPDPKPEPKPAKKKTTSVQSVEVLNPDALQDSEASDPEFDEQMADSEEIEASEVGKEFAKIKIGDYKAALQFISTHPDVLAEAETDGLLVLAFNDCLSENYDSARQCVHQGLLLQYCRVLGRDGVGLFFKRIMTPGHQAQKVFFDDVNTTFGRIKTRAQELQKQRAKGETEVIQLNAMNPEEPLAFMIPSKDSTIPSEVEVRKIFEGFPIEMQRALENGSIDDINKVLLEMNVEEAEEIVRQLGDTKMLCVQEGVIDATTEEGQAELRKMEAQG